MHLDFLSEKNNRLKVLLILKILDLSLHQYLDLQVIELKTNSVFSFHQGNNKHF